MVCVGLVLSSHKMRRPVRRVAAPRAERSSLVDVGRSSKWGRGVASARAVMVRVVVAVVVAVVVSMLSGRLERPNVVLALEGRGAPIAGAPVSSTIAPEAAAGHILSPSAFPIAVLIHHEVRDSLGG